MIQYCIAIVGWIGKNMKPTLKQMVANRLSQQTSKLLKQIKLRDLSEYVEWCCLV